MQSGILLLPKLLKVSWLTKRLSLSCLLFDWLALSATVFTLAHTHVWYRSLRHPSSSLNTHKRGTFWLQYYIRRLSVCALVNIFPSPFDIKKDIYYTHTHMLININTFIGRRPAMAAGGSIIVHNLAPNTFIYKNTYVCVCIWFHIYLEQYCT